MKIKEQCLEEATEEREKGLEESQGWEQGWEEKCWGRVDEKEDEAVVGGGGAGAEGKSYTKQYRDKGHMG